MFGSPVGLVVFLLHLKCIFSVHLITGVLFLADIGINYGGLKLMDKTNLNIKWLHMCRIFRG